MVVGLAPPPDREDAVFHALADATRRAIVRDVLVRPASVSELARRFPMSFAAVQKHVVVLERAGLVTKHKQGREQLVAGSVDGLRTARLALEQLEQVWRERFGRMQQVLDDESDGPVPGPEQGAAT